LFINSTLDTLGYIAISKKFNATSKIIGIVGLGFQRNTALAREELDF
jgi:hypothetical protein